MVFTLMIFIAVIPLMIGVFMLLYGKNSLTIALFLFMIFMGVWQADVSVLYAQSFLTSNEIHLWFRALRFGQILAIPALYQVAYAASRIDSRNSIPWWSKKTILYLLYVWSLFVYLLNLTKYGVSGFEILASHSQHPFWYPISGSLGWVFKLHYLLYVIAMIFNFVSCTRLKNRNIGVFLFIFSSAATISYFIGLLNVNPDTNSLVPSAIACLLQTICNFAAFAHLQANETKYQAYHDHLTGLPNRLYFHEYTEKLLYKLKASAREFSLILLDIDRFKNINDTLGHTTGDRVLQMTAARILESVPKTSFVSRLGGEEFVIVLDTKNQKEVSENLLNDLSRPICFDGNEVYVTASLGVSTYPNDGDTLDDVLASADIAMYTAKKTGGNAYRIHGRKPVYAEGENVLRIEGALRKAIAQDELTLHFQPQIDLMNLQPVGIEALLRWDSGELGSVPPQRFISLAEETGLIIPIGEWVLRTACAKIAEWQLNGFPRVPVSINLSARQFQDPELYNRIMNILQETGMDPCLLDLEITETAIMHNEETVISTLNAFRSIGAHISIDDFGTGYSSLQYLNILPIDRLKIDKSFLLDIKENSKETTIVKKVVELGHSLGMKVVAEGVETSSQLDFLREIHCDFGQGYLFSRPVPEEEILKYFSSHYSS